MDAFDLAKVFAWRWLYVLSRKGNFSHRHRADLFLDRFLHVELRSHGLKPIIMPFQCSFKLLSYDALILLAIMPDEVGYLSFGVAEGVSAMLVEIPSSLPSGDTVEKGFSSTELSWIWVTASRCPGMDAVTVQRR